MRIEELKTITNHWLNYDFLSPFHDIGVKKWIEITEMRVQIKSDLNKQNNSAVMR